MGHSAGGHLALLYAYKSAAGHTTINNAPMHPISLVISEAGPIEFIAGNMTNLADERKAEICAMAGIESISESNQPALDVVSPYCVAEQAKEANKTLPFTILAYGYGIQPYTPMSYEKLYGDGLIPIKPALDLYSLLSNESKTTAHISENSGSFSSSNDNYVLYYFYEIGHNDFSLKNKVHPFTELENNELKEVILDYYDKINEKLNPPTSS